MRKKILSLLLSITMVAGLLPIMPPQKASATVDPSLKLWYKFNEGNGTTVNDSSGNNHSGTLNGTCSWTTAPNGSGAIELDGNSGYVQIPNGILNGITDTTITTSVYVDQANVDPAWIYTFGSSEYSGDVNTKYFSLLEDGGHNLRNTISLNRWENEQNTAKGGALAQGVWKNIAFTLSGTTGTLYEDGVQIAQNTNVTNTPKDIGDMYNYIGKPEYSADRYLKGKVSDFRVYNRALSASEVKNVWIENLSDTEAVATVKGLLDLGDISGVKANMNLPSAYGNTTISWSSDNRDIIKDDGTVIRPADANATVHLTASIARGSVTDTKIFTATVLKSGTVYSLDSTAYTLCTNTTHSTVLTATMEDLSTQNVTASSTFDSSNPSVATVDAAGVVKGIAPGNATITATYNGVAYSAAVTVVNDMVVWYKLDEALGSTASDSSGNGRNGTLNGGAAWLNGNGVQLNGSDGYVKMPDNILQGVDDMTISAYMKMDSTATAPQWLATFSNSANGYIYFAPNLGGQFRYSITPNQWWGEKQVGTSPINNNVWKQVAVTYSASTGTTALYVDGAEVQTGNITQKPSSLEPTNSNFIGRPWPGYPDQYFKGCVSDFRVYKRVLSASELTDITKVHSDKTALDLGVLSSVTGNINLPTSGTNGSTITWQSSDSAIGTDGTVTRPGSGQPDKTVTLTATIKKGNIQDTKSFTAVVLASQTVGVTGVTLDQSSARINRGQTLQLTATVSPSDAANKTVIWSSSDNSIATVTGGTYNSETGTTTASVTAIAEGNATITVTTQMGNKTANCSITVNPDLESGKVLWYKFDETSGTMAFDSSGNGHNGTLNGGATWTNGGGIQLDGSSGYVKMPDGILTGLNSATVSAMVFVDPSIVYPSWVFNFGTTADSYNDANAHYFGLLLSPSAYRVVLAKAHWSDEQNTLVNSGFSTGVWKYVTYTQTGTTGTLYVDGVQVAQNTNVAYTPQDMENTVANFIGRAPYTLDKYFKGKIKDFRLYNRALSSSEVAQICDGGSADIVALDKAALNLGDLSNVTSNITLPASGANGSVITWASSDPDTVSASGVVTRPQYPETDKTVTLTATITKGSASDTKIFTATVIALGQSQDQAIETAKTQLIIHNADDIRGNITLPTTVKVGQETVNVSWTTNKPEVVNVNEAANANYDNTPPGVVTRQAADAQVTLTAHLTHGASTGTKDIQITVKARPASINEADFKGYLFAYFNGSDRPDAEQIYFSTSQDALHWNTLNDNNPVLTSNVGDKGVRDPFILRSPEGDKFYMVATDLRIANGAGWGAAQTAGSKSVVVWESNDLVNWSNERLVKVATDDAGCTWAPEVVYDDKTGEYVMFWASRVGADNYAKQRIYIAKTRDFYTFTAPEVWLERPQDVIDADVIKYNGQYYRFSKDEAHSNIVMDECDQLLHKQYTAISSPSVESQSGVEGPAAFKFNGQNKWGLLLDNYGGGGYYPMVSTDIASGVFTRLSASEYDLPPGPRHGTVMQITQAEYNAIMAKWYRPVVKPDEQPQTNPILEYKFDEQKSGNTILDSSGNNRNGTLNGNATYVQDAEKNSQVLHLDGTSGTFAAFPQGFFEGRDTVTVSMDIKPVTASGNFFTFAIGKDNTRYMFLRTRDTEIRNAITVNSWSSEQEVKSSTASIANKWMNIKLVITPTSMAIYKDGRLLSKNNNVSISMSDLGTNLLAYLGKSFYAPDPYFEGFFDNVKVYNRALTEQEIANEFGITDDQVKIISADDVTVTTSVGHTPQLPSKVKVRYSNNTTGDVNVTWDSIDPSQYSNTGNVTVQGTLYDSEYDNPLILNRADPYIYKHTDGYYYFTASYTDASEGHNNVGMYQYDRIILRKAATIQGLATAEEKVIYTKAPINGNGSPHVWAPEIHFIDGDWYIYYAATISDTDIWQIRPQVLKCPGNLDPMIKENWQYMGQIRKTNPSDMAFNWFSLDATTFVNNGTRYLVWAQTDPVSNLYIARMKDPLTIDNNAVKISTPTYDWEKHGYEVNEGPSVLMRNGKIFISYSASATDALYCLGLLTASDTSDLLNPNSWVKSPNPVFKYDAATGQYGPGHNSFTVSEDGKDDILVYHAREEEKYLGNGYEPLYDAGRNTRVQKLYWNSDGTPNFGAPVADGKVLSSVKAKAKVIITDQSQANPVLEYKFDETKADNNAILDTSGNNYTGTLNGNATYITDSQKNSQVLYLDGTSGTFAAFPQGFFDNRAAVTISMDIKPKTVTGNFFTFAIGKDSTKYMFLRTRDTEIRNAITVNSWNSEQEVKASTASIEDKWMNIKLVITPTSMAIYKDGRLLSKNNNVSISMSDLGTNLLAYLGKSFYSEDDYFKGYFDNVKVYNRAMTELEIAKEFGITDVTLIKGASAAGNNIITTKADSANRKVKVYFSRSNSTIKDLKSVPLNYVLAEGCTIDGTNGQNVDLSNSIKVTINLPDNSKEEWTVEGVLSNNPVLGGQYADPDIHAFDGKFYIYPTTDGYPGWSGTQFHVFSSNDMVNFQDGGIILDAGRNKDVKWSVGSAWAPTIEKKNGKYYFYFCAKRPDGASCIGVATSTSPTGPFVAEESPLLTPEIASAEGVSVGQTIDPSVFTDEDGKSYLLFGNGSPAIVELNDDMISLKSGTMKNITGATDFRESMTVIKRNGLYHFTWSCDDTGSENYHVNYGTSNSLYGPIQYQYAVLSKDTSKDILGTGHQSILKVPGKDEYYIAYHRFVTPLGQYNDGLGYHRETCIDKVEFDAASGLMKVITPTLEGAAPVSLQGFVNVQSICLNKSTSEIIVGENDTIVATIAPNNAANKAVIFTTSSSAVSISDPVVDEASGTTHVVITGLSTGTAVINAITADGYYTAICTIKVNPNYDLKPFTIRTNGTLVRSSGINASVNLGLTPGAGSYNGKGVVIFELMKGNTPIKLVIIDKDSAVDGNVSAHFDVDSNDTAYKVRVYAVDALTSDMTAPISLAEGVTLQ